MPTTTIYASKDASAIKDLNAASFSGWSGSDDHLPVGTSYNSNYKYRSFVYFPISFTGWTGITEAKLYLRAHSTGTNLHCDNDAAGAVMIVKCMGKDWGEGSTLSEGNFSSTQTWDWDNRAFEGRTSPSTTRTFSGSLNDGDWYSVDITDHVISWAPTSIGGGGQANYGLILINDLESATTTAEQKALQWYSRNKGSGYKPYITITYTTNTAPNAPTDLSPTGGEVKNTLTPTFSGTFSDDDAGDSLSGVQVIVYESNGTTVKWDSGDVSASGTSFAVAYAGTALTGNTTYKWKARTKDSAGEWGAYSAQQTFIVNSTPNQPTLALSESPTTALATLTPTFLVTHNDPDATDTKAYKYRIVVETSDGATTVWDSGETSLTTPIATLSKTMPSGYLSWQTSYRWKAMTQDANGAWSAYSSYSSFTTRTTGAPITLSPDGTTISGIIPTLTGARASSSDSLTSVDIEVYTVGGTSPIWSYSSATGVTSSAFSVPYAGSTLAYSTSYEWRARVTGSTGGTSAWTAKKTFTTGASGAVELSSPSGLGISDLTPDCTFTRTTSFNAYQIEVVRVSDSASMWAPGTVTHTSATSKTVTYAGTALAYGTEYKWRVRVSSDSGSTWGAGWSDYVFFTTETAGVPTLTAPINSSWQTTLTPTFTGTTFNSEVISTYRIRLYASDGSTLVWDSGDLAGSGTSFSKVYNGSTALVAGNQYYWQASYVKSGGAPGGYSALETFHINAAPTAPLDLYPTNGLVIGDDTTPPFRATFADPDKTLWGDYPTKVQWELYNNATSAYVGGMEKVTSLVSGENEQDWYTALSYDVEYKYRCRYVDSKSENGSWSSFVVFMLAQSATVAITAPAGTTVSSPAFTISWTFTSPSGYLQESYRVIVTRDSDDVVVYDSGVVYDDATSYSFPTGYLQNGLDYTISVVCTDENGLSTNTATKTVTASWTPPDAIEDFSATVDETTSIITLNWLQSTEADFAYYRVYRRRAGDSTWTRLATISNISTTSYKDYYAGQGYTYEYKLTQFVTVSGDADLESVDSDFTAATLESDVWFAIGADRSVSHSGELPVVDEDHNLIVQQEVFEPLGSRRKAVVRGNVLGYEGTLSLMWASDEREDAKTLITYLAETGGPHILKSPMGDVWDVDFSGPGIKYQPGGHMQTTLSWTEVD